MIPFNKPYLSGKEIDYIREAVSIGHVSGNGFFTKESQNFFEKRFGFEKCLLTTSCTDALEMAAILANIGPGDEVIMPSYTFVSTANAFVLRGAKVVFVDSNQHNPNMDVSLIDTLVTSKTRAIVPVHYAGVGCNMDAILEVASKHNLLVIEDAAQAIDSYYNNKPLGSLGHFAALSFHETKNIQCGEGGMLVVNDKQFAKRAEIIWEKGTNRAEFFRGEASKYGWVDVGSSFLPSDMIAAFLLAQLENLQSIQERRLNIWERYYKNLKPLAHKNLITLPYIDGFATNNAHMFYILCNNRQQRDGLIMHLKENGFLAVFHYLPLHLSQYYMGTHDGRELPNSVRYSQTIIRLPFFYELTNNDIDSACELIEAFFHGETR